MIATLQSGIIVYRMRQYMAVASGLASLVLAGPVCTVIFETVHVQSNE